VQTNSSGASITVAEASKTNVDASYFRPISVTSLRIRSQNAFGSDELVINFESNATSGFDFNFDAKKITSSNASLPSISSNLNGIDYSINQINPQEINIPIKILSGFSGNHNITIENANLFNNASCLILEDLFTNTFYDLSVVDSFSTYIYDTTQTARFLLHVGAPIDITTTDVSAFGNNDGKIIYTRNSSSSFNIVWKNSLNNVLKASNNIITSDTLDNIPGGIYYIETTDLLCGNSIDTILVTEPSQTTSIQNLTTTNDTKVWINNNNLIIKGNDINNIVVRNLLGQLLFTSTENHKEMEIFNLESLSSQLLIVTTSNNNKVSSKKVIFVNTNN